VLSGKSDSRRGVTRSGGKEDACKAFLGGCLEKKSLKKKKPLTNPEVGGRGIGSSWAGVSSQSGPCENAK